MSSRFLNLFNNIKNHQGFRRYYENTSWMFAEQILRMGAGLLVGIWVARYLGPSQFGVFSYAIAFAALFSTFAKLGLDSILVRDLIRVPDQTNHYMGTAFWLKLLGAIAMLALIAFATPFTSNNSTTTLYIFIIASGSIFQSFEVIDFYFQSKVLSKFVAISRFTQLLISTLIKLYLILIDADLLWFVVVSLLDQITLAISLLFVYRYQKLAGFYRFFDKKIAKQLLYDSWPLIISGLVITVYMRIDQIMIKMMLGEKEVGLYSAAVTLSEVWYFIPMIISNSLFPSIINAIKVNKSLYHTRVRRLYTFMFWSAIVIALPMSLLSDWLVILLYGKEFREAGKVLMIHAWAAVFVFWGTASSKWFICEGLLKYLIINVSIGAIVNILLNFILIPKYGICGAAFATVIAQSVASYFMNLAFKKTRSNFFRLTESVGFSKWRISSCVNEK